MKRVSNILLAYIASLLFLVPPTSYAAEYVYQKPTAFISEAFSGTPPVAKILTVVGEIRKAAGKILGHPPATIRIRYWKKEKRTVWILEGIGKVLPITAGFIVQSGVIEDVRILIYRESHGAEVRHRYFTEQFAGANLIDGQNLNKSIDGISGATLSVGAIRRLAALALYYDQQVAQK